MRALVYHGRYDVRLDTVPDPPIEQPQNAIIKVTSTAICGSDLHLYDGYIPAMEKVTFVVTSSWGKWLKSAGTIRISKSGIGSSSRSISAAENVFFALKASGRAASGPTETPIKLPRCLATTRPARRME